MRTALRSRIPFPFFAAEWARQIYKKFEHRSNRRDWFTILAGMASVVAEHGPRKGAFEWLDIGAGECHSTIQQLSVIRKATKQKVVLDIDIDVLEPSSYSLAQCLLRLHSIKKDIVFRNFFKAGWHEAKLPFRYDLISAVHSAYYFTPTEKDFRQVLRKIWFKLKKGGIAQLLILPSYSAFYRVIGWNYFGNWVYAENILRTLREMGFKPKTKEFSMKLNIDDVFRNRAALYEFWLFMMNKRTGSLNASERKRFLDALKAARFKHNGRWVMEMNDWFIWFRKP